MSASPFLFYGKYMAHRTMTIMNMDLCTLIIIACVIFLIVYHMIRNRSSVTLNVPGPSGWPIVGNLLSLDPKAPYLSLSKFADQYGPLFSLRFGSFPVVVLNSYTMAKEALVKNGDDYDDRPKMVVFEFGKKGKGFFGAYSDRMLRLRRRFALQALRNLGLVRYCLEDQITKEVQRLLSSFSSHAEKPFCPFEDLDKAFCNAICYIALGKRYEYDDVKFEQVLHHVNRCAEISNFAGLVNFLPICRYLPIGGVCELRTLASHFRVFLTDLIKDLSNNYVQGDPRNFIDMYFDYRAQVKLDVAEKFDDDDLMRCVGDLIAAGIDTTSTTVKWGLLYLMITPNVQEKIQAEMDSAIGRARMPSLKDQPNLPYTKAALMEINRMASVVPLSIPRAANKDTKLLGYDIPKGTVILSNLWAILHDENTWEDPHQFKPDRFLDTNGGLLRMEELIPFSAGKRKCIGEHVARRELFLFFTHLLHRFKFSLPEGAQVPSLQGNMGATLKPDRYNLCAVPRPMD